MKDRQGSDKINLLGLVKVFLAAFVILMFLMPGWIMYNVYLLPLMEKENKAKLALQQDRAQRLAAYLKEVKANKIEDGVHVATGLLVDDHYKLVIQNCTTCHSAQLITQNKATRDNWKRMIEWMQETQNLWDLGENEAPILDYLAKNYAPQRTGRRAPLSSIEWYELKP